MSWHPRYHRTLFINPIAESLQLTPQDSCLSLDLTNTDLRESSCRMIAFWRRHQHQLNFRSVAHHAFDQAQQRTYIVRSHQHSLEPQTFDEYSQERCRVVPRTLPVNNCRSQASNRIVSAFGTKDRQHIFSVTTEEAIVKANVPQLSFLSGRMCVRSTLRRNAMATPASVHCMSRQLVFGDLSCTGLKRKTWHPRHHKHLLHYPPHHLALDRVLLLISLGLLDLGFLVIQVRIQRVCLRFHVDAVRVVLSLYATVQPLYCESLISFWLDASIFFATTVEPLWNRKPSSSFKLHPSTCTLQQTTVAYTPANENIATFDVQSLARLDKFSSCCAESEVTVARNRSPVCDILAPRRLSCSCVNSNLDPFGLSHTSTASASIQFMPDPPTSTSGSTYAASEESRL